MGAALSFERFARYVAWADGDRQKAADLNAERKPIEDGRIGTALTFSFWTTMFGRDHDAFWKWTLHRIATRDGRFLARKGFTTRLTKVRLLRNRIAHYEPILYWNLPEHRQAIRDIALCRRPR